MTSKNITNARVAKQTNKKAYTPNQRAIANANGPYNTGKVPLQSEREVECLSNPKLYSRCRPV